MTKYTSIAALLGVVLSAPVLAANSFQEVAEANSASIWGQEIVEAPAKRAPVLTANSFQEVLEKTRASIWGQEMIGANEAIAVDDRKVDTNL